MKKKIYYKEKETNYSVTSDGKIFNDKTQKELKGTLKRNEYKSVQLSIDKKPKSFMIHRLVAEAFCDNPNNYTIVDHIDGNKLNNNHTNLRWVTDAENRLNANRKINKLDFKYVNINEIVESKEWKPITFNDNYYVNIYGEVVSLKSSRYLIPNERNGYLRYNINGLKYSAHKLVWESFNGTIPNDMVLDHIDGNRSNNNIDNLRLVSQSENMINAQKNKHEGQIIVKQYDKFGNFIAEYNSIADAAKEMGVTHAAIRSASIRKGTCKNYFWITENQDFDIKKLLETSIINNVKSSYIGVTQYDLLGQEIKHYSNLTEAGKAVNTKSETIKKAALELRQIKNINYYWILDKQDITIEDVLNKNNKNK